MNQFFFHTTFVIVFLTMLFVRMYYQIQAKRMRGKVEFKEGKVHQGVRAAIGVPFIITLFVYMYQPSTLAWAQFALPEWLQWVGVVLGAASIPLIVWNHRALGSNFATTLHVREEHTLATTGPYRWVRHPMYTILFIHLLAILLLTANWLIGGVLLGALILIVALRVQNEENAMIEKFGDEYRAYIRQTGRFMPHWSWGGNNG